MIQKENVLNTEEYVPLTVEIPYLLKDKIKFYSYKEKKPIKDVVKDALEKYFLSCAE